MKIFGVLFVATLLIANSYSFPRVETDFSESNEGSDKKNTDTILVLPEKDANFVKSVYGLPTDGKLEDDSAEGYYGSDYSPFYSNVFGGLFSSMQNAVNRLREQMASVLSGRIEQGFAPWGKIPEGANTTSVTKVIDGHVVTINDTTYSDGDDNNGSVIRVRIIDVKPQNDTADTTSVENPVLTSTPKAGDKNENDSRSVETVEDLENEIPKSQGDTLDA